MSRRSRPLVPRLKLVQPFVPMMKPCESSRTALLNLLTPQLVKWLFHQSCSLRSFHGGGVTTLSSPDERRLYQIVKRSDPPPLLKAHQLPLCVTPGVFNQHAPPRPQIKSQSVPDPQAGFDQIVNPGPQSGMRAPPPPNPPMMAESLKE